MVGALAATIALVVLWFVTFGLFTGTGLLIAGLIAALIGTAAGALAEPDRAGRNALFVECYVAALLLVYLFTVQTVARPPGSLGGAGVPQGGPGVMPPPPRGRCPPVPFRPCDMADDERPVPALSCSCDEVAFNLGPLHGQGACREGAASVKVPAVVLDELHLPAVGLAWKRSSTRTKRLSLARWNSNSSSPGFG